MKRQTLWTYDFTVITIGSFVSLVGSILSSFAVSLLILDHTGSTFLYMAYNVAYALPMMICPVLVGPYLDRASRKKVIYGLDFLSSGIYLVLFLLLREGWFSYPVLLMANILTGAINSIYSVAYDSFYPNLIAEGNFRKAYSIASLLEDVAFMVYPLGAVLYQSLGGAAALFAINAVSFFLAACFEATVHHQETHMADAPRETAQTAAGQFRRELREGIDYVKGEKGLLMVALYMMVSSMAGGAEQLQLPYFLNHAERFAAWPVAAATLYAILSNFLLAGIILFLPVPLMAVSFFANGMMGVTSYTIRTAATQTYVPDGKRARYNSVIQMLSALGSVVGVLLAGVLGEVLPERGIIAGANVLMLAAVYLFIWRGREHVKKVYNRNV